MARFPRLGKASFGLGGGGLQVVGWGKLFFFFAHKVFLFLASFAGEPRLSLRNLGISIGSVDVLRVFRFSLYTLIFFFFIACSYTSTIILPLVCAFFVAGEARVVPQVMRTI